VLPGERIAWGIREGFQADLGFPAKTKEVLYEPLSCLPQPRGLQLALCFQLGKTWGEQRGAV